MANLIYPEKNTSKIHNQFIIKALSKLGIEEIFLSLIKVHYDMKNLQLTSYLIVKTEHIPPEARSKEKIPTLTMYIALCPGDSG